VGKTDLGDGAWFCLLLGWAPSPDALFSRLLAETTWEQRTLRLYGREVKEPRLVAYHGDPGAAYTYSGRKNEPLPWTSDLSALRHAISETTTRAGSVRPRR
jgi:alkylated DNA repair dioxygenase AlkB